MLNHLMQIEKARGFLEAAHLSNQWIRKMSRNAFLLETHHTTHIEGTQLTLDQSKRVLAGKDIPKANEKDVKEVKNYRDAFKLVSDYLKKETTIKESFIKGIHKELVKGVRGGSANPGMYRDRQNSVGNSITKEIIYTPPKPGEVPSLMKDFVKWINEESEIHPVLKSGIIQFQFVHIHPFVDGNGRTSRLLCAAYLHKKDYDFKRLFSISEYYDKDRNSFYKAIQSVRDSDMDMTVWIEYFVEGFLVQMNDVMTLGKKVIFKDALIKDHNLSQRQAVIIEHILENGKLAPKDLDIRITRRTFQRDLKDMVDKKILRVKGKTNQKTYYLRQDA